MDFQEPLVGTRAQNYKYFYATGGASIISFIILVVISGYTAYIATDMGILMTDMNKIIVDIKELLPDAKESLRIVKEMCRLENFTKQWGHICQ